MKQIKLEVENRKTISKSVNKALRRSGAVPGIVYHRGEEAKAIHVANKDLHAVISTEAGRNVLLNLVIKGEGKDDQRIAVVKELQRHPVTGSILHVDLQEISLTEKIEVEVPIREKGEPAGVTADGGILEIHLRMVMVKCLPTDIPEHIDIDISHLRLNEAIYVKNLPIPSNVELLSDPESVVVQVVVPHVEIPAEEEIKAEPEVIGEKKEDAAETDPEAAKAKPQGEESKKTS